MQTPHQYLYHLIDLSHYEVKIQILSTEQIASNTFVQL